MRLALLAAVLLLAPGCGGGGDGELTIYLAQRLGPEGPNGQIAPVLMPVGRERRTTLGAARQGVLELRGGPAPGERARGFLDTLHPSTRLVGLQVEDGVALVELAGVEPDLRAAAAIVYTLTELPGIRKVRLRVDGRGCCVYTHAGTSVRVLTREGFGGWTGHPCHLRSENRCRG